MNRVANFNLVQRILKVNYFSDLKLQVGRVFRAKTSGHGLNQIPQTLLNTSQVVVFVGESLRSLEIRGKLIVARCAPNSVLIGLPTESISLAEPLLPPKISSSLLMMSLRNFRIACLQFHCVSSQRLPSTIGQPPKALMMFRSGSLPRSFTCAVVG